MRISRIVGAGLLAIVSLGVGATGTLAAPPVHEHSGRYVDRFADDFILDLCGIQTMTTVTVHWTLTTYSDGTQRFRVSRMFVSDDPRLPIERGAGMTTFLPDGTKVVHGSPIRLQRRGEGIILLDAGLAIFGDDLTVRGPHPSLEADLADHYCPR